VTTITGHSDIQRVRDATDLVRLISEHVALRPQGREFVGLCPFHDDHRPSLHVVTHKDHAFYKCFACGVSGDCFRFVMDYHKMDFPEALKYLADKAGITLSARAGKRRPDAGEAPKRGNLQNAAQFAADFFRRTLSHPVAGEAARTLITKRGISEEMVQRFMLGAAPDGYEGFLRTLNGKASAIRTALAAGLLKQRSGDTGYYDTFRNRLIFPICDDVGRPIAFGGRVLDDAETPKYLNSPESPLFHKSRTLFALHLAKRSIIDSKQVIVTEGYTDVMACHQAGITNVVGTLGTALTAEHARLLSRLCESVVLVFDGDEAGRHAADRALRILFAEPVDILLCILPEGHDPDDLLKQDNGTDRFRAAVDEAVPALSYKLRCVREQLGEQRGASARQKLLERFMGELADLGFGSIPGVRKRLIYNEICDLFNVSLADVEQALPHRRPYRPGPIAEPPTVGANPPDATVGLLDDAAEAAAVSRARRLAERDLLAILLFEPPAGATEGEASPVSWLSLTDFTDPVARRIAETVLPRVQQGAPYAMQEILTDLASAEAQSLASQLFFEGQARCGDDETAAGDALRTTAETLQACIQRERYQQQLAALRSPDTNTGGTEEVRAALERIREQHRFGDVPAAIPQGLRS